MVQPRMRLRALALLLPILVTLALARPAHAEIPREPLQPGTSAIVRADGDCLRVRENPGLAATPVACIPEGSTVVVLPSAEEADGYRWQLINTGTLTGWVADEFLRAYSGPANTAACQSTSAASAIRPGLAGFVPTAGGIGQVIWGGGTLPGIDNTAAARGCQLNAVWAADAEGNMLPYIIGVPSFVNAAWRAAFPSGRLPADKVIFIICAEPDSIRASVAALEVPGSNANAPTLVGGPAPVISAAAAVVIDEASGAVLFDKGAHRRLAPASLTKIATAIVAIEGADPASWVPSDVDSRRMPGSSVVGLIPGDCFKMNDLLYGLMLPSGNDAALAIARYGAGSDAAFVQEMNTLVKRLGLRDTKFTDPHGLGSPQHYSSAYDIAMLSRYGMALPAFREIVRTPSYTAKGGRTLSMLNVNSFLRGYGGADGVKTGYTEDAGRTLSASAVKNGRRVYVVLMNSVNRDEDARALLDWAFTNHRW